MKTGPDRRGSPDPAETPDRRSPILRFNEFEGSEPIPLRRCREITRL